MHHVVFSLRAENPEGFSVRRNVDPKSLPPRGELFEESPHLVWWLSHGDAAVTAHYVFDEVYAAAHPEALDPRHLALLHSLLNFKLFDDGDLLVPPRQLRGALRWPRLDEARRAMGAQ